MTGCVKSGEEILIYGGQISQKIKRNREMIKDIGNTFQLKQWMLSCLFLTMHFNLVTDPPQVRYYKRLKECTTIFIKKTINKEINMLFHFLLALFLAQVFVVL